MAYVKPRPHHMGGQDIAVDNSKDPVQGKPKSNIPTHSEVGTATTATAIDNPSILDVTRFRLPGAATVMSSTVVKIKYPRPPKMKKDAKLFKCPCCCQALPAELAENEKWKKHLAGDIVPYTCILPNCATPDVLFPTKDAWRRHLLEEHCSYQYWTCSICREGIELPNEESFVWHTKTQHAGSISQDRISVLAGLSRRSSPIEMKNCPICGWPETEGATADKESLIEHIAKEIHAFSLHSLPWADEPEHTAAGDTWIIEHQEKVMNWLREIEHMEEVPSLDLMDLSGKPLAEPTITHADYFQHNAYFADSSSSASTEHTSSAAQDHSIEKYQKTTEGSISFQSNPSRHCANSEHTSAGDYDTEDNQKVHEWLLPIENNPGRHSVSPETDEGLPISEYDAGSSSEGDEFIDDEGTYDEGGDDEGEDEQEADHEEMNEARRHLRGGGCSVRGCHRRTVYAELTDGRIRSVYCQEHTCQGPRSALEGFCPRQRNPTNKCCSVHGKCRITGCILQAPRATPNHELPWTCPPHQEMEQRRESAQEHMRRQREREYHRQQRENFIKAEVSRRLQIREEERIRGQYHQEEEEKEEERRQKELVDRVETEFARRDAARRDPKERMAQEFEDKIEAEVNRLEAERRDGEERRRLELEWNLEVEKHRKMSRRIGKEESLEIGEDRSRDIQPEADDDPQRLE